MPSTVTKKQPKANPKKSTSTSSKNNNKQKPMKLSPPSLPVDSDSSDSNTSTKTKKSNRRHHHKRKSAQPKLQQTSSTPIQVETRRRTRSNSAVDYAGPQFMYCSPSPTSLPKPPTVEKKQPKPLQSISLDIRQKQPTLYERSLQQQSSPSSKLYTNDPISDIQEKLRILLKLQ